MDWEVKREGRMEGKKATTAGFELARAKPNRFRVCLLNHSDKLSVGECGRVVVIMDGCLGCDVDSGSIIMKGQLYPNMVVMTIGYEHANHIP